MTHINSEEIDALILVGNPSLPEHYREEFEPSPNLKALEIAMKTSLDAMLKFAPTSLRYMAFWLLYVAQSHYNGVLTELYRTINVLFNYPFEIYSTETPPSLTTQALVKIAMINILWSFLEILNMMNRRTLLLARQNNWRVLAVFAKVSIPLISPCESLRLLRKHRKHVAPT